MPIDPIDQHPGDYDKLLATVVRYVDEPGDDDEDGGNDES
jgi:hypothetical protein